MIDFTLLHVGLTNRCRLLCPECTRTTPHNKYIHNMFDIDVEYFKEFLLGCNPNVITFCGNWGDPIYSKDFIGLVHSIKQEHPTCQIITHTNGSGKSAEWWERLMAEFNEHDLLFFSIDGSPENYMKYRVNSQWEDVETAIKSCVKVNNAKVKKARIKWKHIVFSFNENTIMDSYEKSIELGIGFELQHALVVVPGGNDWLAPSRPFEEIEHEFNQQKSKSVLR